MYRYKFASLIDDAVLDCLAYGSGKARHSDPTTGVTIDVWAEWMENETDIQITVLENSIVRFQFADKVPEEFR